MSFLNVIKKKGNLLEKDDLKLLEDRVIQLRTLIDTRLTLYGLPKSCNDLTVKYCEELKDIQKFVKKKLKERKSYDEECKKA